MHCIVDLLQCVVVRSARPYPKKKATRGAELLQCVWFSVVAVLLQCVVVRSARLRPQQKATCVWCNIVAVLCECVAGRSRTHTKMKHVWCSVVQCVAMLLHCGGCVSHLQIDRFPANSKVICSLRNDAHQVLSCHVAYIDKSCQTHINESCHANHDTCGHVWYCHIISYSYIRHIIVARYVCTHIYKKI